MRPLLLIIFPQGFRISKNIGHPTLGRRLNDTSKVNTQTDGQTHRQTHGHTDGHFNL